MVLRRDKALTSTKSRTACPRCSMIINRYGFEHEGPSSGNPTNCPCQASRRFWSRTQTLRRNQAPACTPQNQGQGVERPKMGIKQKETVCSYLFTSVWYATTASVSAGSGGGGSSTGGVAESRGRGPAPSAPGLPFRSMYVRVEAANLTDWPGSISTGLSFRRRSLETKVPCAEPMSTT